MLITFSTNVHGQINSQRPFKVKKNCEIIYLDSKDKGDWIPTRKLEEKIIGKCLRESMRNSSYWQSKKWIKSINKYTEEYGFIFNVKKEKGIDYYLTAPDGKITKIYFKDLVYDTNRENLIILFMDEEKSENKILAFGELINADEDYQFNLGLRDSSLYLAKTQRMYVYRYNAKVEKPGAMSGLKVSVIDSAGVNRIIDSIIYKIDIIKFYDFKAGVVSRSNSNIEYSFSYTVPYFISGLSNPIKERVKHFYIYNDLFVYQEHGVVFINDENLNKKIGSEYIKNYTFINDKPAYLFSANDNSNSLYFSYDNYDYGKLGFDKLYWLNSNWFSYKRGDMILQGKKKRRYYSIQIK